MEIDGRVGAATGQGLFHVKARRSGDWWALSVDGHPGIHSQAKTLAKAEAAIREAIELALDLEPDTFAVHVMPDLDHELLLDLIRSKQLTHEAGQLQQAAAALTRQVAARLSELGLSQRDVAQVMGVSFQRINQLLGDDVPALKMNDVLAGLNDTITAIRAHQVISAREYAVGPITHFLATSFDPGDSWLGEYRLIADAHAGVSLPEAVPPRRRAGSTSGRRTG